jgi:hypothetical protein
MLSRKDHWDLILLAQDHEMIDAQVRTTLCDYLVQASRLDRQKIPYLGSILKKLGLNSMMPRVHRYYVYYGLSTAVPPQDVWSFTGKYLYDAYDTNQKFTLDQEYAQGKICDMRATYSYIPCNYLTRQIFVDRLKLQIEQLKTPTTENELTMARKTATADTSMMKFGLLAITLLLFLGWRFFSGGFTVPKAEKSVETSTKPDKQASQSDNATATIVNTKNSVPVAIEYAAPQVNEFMATLLKKYRPRLSATAYSPEIGYFGTIYFYDNFEIIETYSIKELHALGAILIRKPYGVDLIFDNKTFLVSSWRLPSSPVSVEQEPMTVSQNSPLPAHNPDPMTDALYKP